MKNKPDDLLIEQLISTAHKFRLGKEAEGSVEFSECINRLEPLLTDPTKTQAFIQLFPAMLAAQERYDWLALADLLEYELPIQLSYLLAN
ncbi:hypothetical protein ACQKC5_18410 [Shewanella baltica]|uniref:hypothetical protein n=1 Tax=Shewanella baltica TaxID=62322 RepID=UPI003D0032A7